MRTRQGLVHCNVKKMSAIRRQGAEFKASLGYRSKLYATLCQQKKKKKVVLTRHDLAGAPGAVVTVSLWNLAGKGSKAYYCEVKVILGRKPLNSWGLNQGPYA